MLIHNVIKDNQVQKAKARITDNLIITRLAYLAMIAYINHRYVNIYLSNCAVALGNQFSPLRIATTTKPDSH